MTEAAALLQQLGFSEYDARAYIALLERHPLNGYELAKASGIPRANIYAVLQRLEDWNAVIRVDGEGSVHYAPVPPHELIPQIQTHFQNCLGDAQRSLEAISGATETNLSRNIVGRSALLQQAQALIDSAQDSLVLAVWHSDIEVLAESIARAEQRHVQIMTLCLGACSHPCSQCKGTIYRYRLSPEGIARWLVVIQDSQEMIMGEIEADEATAIRTGQQSLIQMAVQYIRSSIAWAAVLQSSGQRLMQGLPAETQRILRELGPNDSWLTYMRHLLHDGSIEPN